MYFSSNTTLSLLWRCLKHFFLLRRRAQTENTPPWFNYNEEYKSVEIIPENSDTGWYFFKVSELFVNLFNLVLVQLVDWTTSDSATQSDVSSENEEELNTDTDDDLSSQPEKYLIFTTGSKTNTPHQIGKRRNFLLRRGTVDIYFIFFKGIKRIGQVSFPKKLDPGPSVMERIAECRERAQRPAVVIDNLNIDNLSRNYDSVDHLIELHGHIIGMKLSPDHR